MGLDPQFYPGILERSSYQYVDDYLPIWEAISTPTGRLTLLDMLTQGPSIFERTYYITEDVDKVRTVQANGAITTGVTIQLESGHAAYVQKGDQLHQYHNGKEEWLQINADPDQTNDIIAVTRNINGTGVEGFDDNSTFRIVRNRPTGSEADEPEFKGTIRRTNYSGIISHTVKADGTAQAGNPRVPYGSELDRQEAEILTSLRWELEDLMLYGPGIAHASGAYGQMKGIRKQIVDLAGSNISTDSVRFGYKQVCGRINWLHKEGFIKPSDNVALVCPSDGAHLAGLWGASAVGREASDRTFGMETRVIHSTLGMDVPIIWSPAVMPTEYMILNFSKIKKLPMEGRELIRMRKAAGSDLQDWDGRRILMEWGNIVQYADRAHYLQKNVTFEE